MAKVEHIHCSNMRCSNDSSGGPLATVEFDGGVKVPLCQPCLNRSGFAIQVGDPIGKPPSTTAGPLSTRQGI